MPTSSRAVIRAAFSTRAGIASRAQTDVVGEDDRPVHVVVPMHRVDPVDQGDLEPALECPRLELVVGLGPALGSDVVGVGITSAEHRAQRVARNVGLVVNGLEIGLGHLADLLVQSHGLEQFLGFRRRGASSSPAASAARLAHPR